MHLRVQRGEEKVELNSETILSLLKQDGAGTEVGGLFVVSGLCSRSCAEDRLTGIAGLLIGLSWLLEAP